MGCIQSKLPNLRRHRRWCCDPRRPSADSDSRRGGADPPPLTNHHLLTGNSVGTAAVPSAGVALHYSSLTQRGHYPDSPNRHNQDSFLIKTNLQSNPNLHLFAVFDGHGQFGTECAVFARETLGQILSNNPDLAGDPAKSFASAFETTNALLRSSDIDDSMSGTTGIAVLVCGGSLYVANVGDSRAVAGVYNAARNCVAAEDLSCDQTPFRKDEYERVRRCGARVLSVDQVEGIKDPEVQSWGDEESDEGDPPRLWVQNGMYPGTAFTRSVGDSTAEGIGVIAMPEVKEVKITPDHLFFVVASDGVFEFLSSQAVVNMVASFKDPRDACAAIAAESYKKWLEHENRTDDITIVIVHIKDMGDSDSVVTDEARQISSRATQLTSEKPHVEGHAFQGPGTGHARRGSSVSELQGIADFTTDRSPACVAPSPEHKVTFKT